MVNGIKKFDGTRFEVWTTLMEAVLTARKLKYVLDSDMDSRGDETKINKFKADDEQARATLLLSLDTKMVVLVLTCKTAKEIWNRLKEVHSQQSVSCKMMLYQQFYNIKMQPEMAISTYVAETELIVRKLHDVGVILDDDTLIGKIVSGLTPDFRHFMTNWMGTPEKERTYANLLPRLMAEETMLLRNVDTEKVALKARAQQRPYQDKGKKKKKELECHYCGTKGHFKRDCRKLKREKSEAKGDKDDNGSRNADGERRYATVAKSSGTKTIKGKFFFDSGASYHMTNNLEWLDDLEQRSPRTPCSKS